MAILPATYGLQVHRSVGTRYFHKITLLIIFPEIHSLPPRQLFIRNFDKNRCASRAEREVSLRDWGLKLRE